MKVKLGTAKSTFSVDTNHIPIMGDVCSLSMSGSCPCAASDYSMYQRPIKGFQSLFQNGRDTEPEYDSEASSDPVLKLNTCTRSILSLEHSNNLFEVDQLDRETHVHKRESPRLKSIESTPNRADGCPKTQT